MIAWWWLLFAVLGGFTLGALWLWVIVRSDLTALGLAERAHGYPFDSPEAQALIDEAAQDAVDRGGVPVIELSVDKAGQYLTVTVAGRGPIVLPPGGQIVSVVTAPKTPPPYVKHVSPAKSVTVIVGEGGAGGGSRFGQAGQPGQPGTGGQGGAGGRGGAGGDLAPMYEYALQMQHNPMDPNCGLHWTVGDYGMFTAAKPDACEKCRDR